MVDSGFDAVRNNTEDEARLTPTLKFSQASKEEDVGASTGRTLIRISEEKGLAIVLTDRSLAHNDRLKVSAVNYEVDNFIRSVDELDKTNPKEFSTQLGELMKELPPFMPGFVIAQKIESNGEIYIVTASTSSDGLVRLRDTGLVYSPFESGYMELEFPNSNDVIGICTSKVEPTDLYYIATGRYGFLPGVYAEDFQEYRNNHLADGTNPAQAFVDFQYQLNYGVTGPPDRFNVHVVGIEYSSKKRELQPQPILATRRPETTISLEEGNENTETIIRIFLEADKKPEKRDLNTILDDLERLDLEKLNDKERKVMEKLGRLLLSEGRESLPEHQIQTQLVNERLLRAISNTNPDFDRADKLLEIAKLLGLDEDPITGKILTTVNSVLTKAKIANMHAKPTPTLEPISPVEPPPMATPSPTTSQPEVTPSQPTPTNPGNLPDWLFLNEPDTQPDIATLLSSGDNPFAPLPPDIPSETVPGTQSDTNESVSEPSPTQQAEATAESHRRRGVPEILALNTTNADVVEQINIGLDLTDRNSVAFEGNNEVLENYLKDLKFNGGRVTDVRTESRPDGSIAIGCLIKGNAGNIELKGFIRIDANGKIIFEEPKIEGKQLIGSLTRWGRGHIEKELKDIDTLAREKLNSQLRSGWEVKGFRIKDGKIAVDFGKGEAVVDAQSVELTRDQQVDIVFKYVREEARKRNVPIQTILDELKQ